MTSREDISAQDPHPARSGPGGDEIDRIVEEIRASPESGPDRSPTADGSDVTDEVPATGDVAGADFETALADLSVRSGPLAPVRRRVKALIHQEARLQVAPVAAELNGLSSEFARRRRLRVAEVAEREAIVSELRRELAAVKDRLNRMERALSRDKRTPPASVATAAGPVETSDNPVQLDYFAFEGLLRGSTDEIAERQSAYVDVFADADDILDVGCGRGELVELLSNSGKRVSGVDLDQDMVESCRERGLQVTVADGIADLAARDAASLGGIAALQVVEHLRPAQLTAFIDGCHRVLKPGGVLLLETINPVTLSAIRNYFADLTHSQPLVPETLKFLVESAGFRDVTIAYQNPLPEIARLRHVPYGDRMTEGAQAESDRNVDLVNATLYGPQDYAVIARV